MTDGDRPSAYVDTNAFVEMFENGSSAAAASLRSLFVRPNDSKLKLCTSELTLAEVLVTPMRELNAQLTQLYWGFIQTGHLLDVLPITRQVLYTAAMTRAEDAATKLPDAIHVATALEHECDWFVTGDMRIRLSRRAKKPFAIVNPFSPDFPKFVEQFAG